MTHISGLSFLPSIPVGSQRTLSRRSHVLIIRTSGSMNVRTHERYQRPENGARANLIYSCHHAILQWTRQKRSPNSMLLILCFIFCSLFLLSSDETKCIIFLWWAVCSMHLYVLFCTAKHPEASTFNSLNIDYDSGSIKSSDKTARDSYSYRLFVYSIKRSILAIRLPLSRQSGLLFQPANGYGIIYWVPSRSPVY